MYGSQSWYKTYYIHSKFMSSSDKMFVNNIFKKKRRKLGGQRGNDEDKTSPRVGNRDINCLALDHTRFYCPVAKNRVVQPSVQLCTFPTTRGMTGRITRTRTRKSYRHSRHDSSFPFCLFRHILGREATFVSTIIFSQRSSNSRGVPDPISQSIFRVFETTRELVFIRWLKKW